HRAAAGLPLPPALPLRPGPLPAGGAEAFGDGGRRGILPCGRGRPPAAGRAAFCAFPPVSAGLTSCFETLAFARSSGCCESVISCLSLRSAAQQLVSKA